MNISKAYERNTMAKAKKATESKEKQERRNQLKEMYTDFSETVGEVLGDTGEFVKKNKTLLLIGFVFFLWYRNKTFSIGSFIKDFEDRLKAKKQDW